MWFALLIGNVIWLGGRGVRVLWILAFPPVALELYHGNIHLWIAAAIALGFRYPWTWGFVLLTKVTPGVGLLWFAVRREWRALGIALGVTGAIVAVSLLLAASCGSTGSSSCKRPRRAARSPSSRSRSRSGSGYRPPSCWSPGAR